MRRTEVRELLGQLEEAPAPEPSALFVAKLEADLRSMDQTSETKAPRARTHRARVLIAAAPIAALATAAAAAAVTLLPSKPHPRELKTADPGLTAPASPSEAPPSSVPTPTTVVVPPPWLPPTAAPSAASPPTTTAVEHPHPTTPPPVPGEHSTPSVAPPHEPVTTTVPPTTTTAPPHETLSLHCTAAMSGGNPIVGCGWTQSTSPSFKWYRVWREAQGSSPSIVFQSDNRTTISYYDTTVQAGTNYYYKLDITDAAGNVIGTSNIVAISCC